MTRRIKDVNETTFLSSGEQTLVSMSTKSNEKKSKTNNLTSQLQMLNNQLFDSTESTAQKHIRVKNNLSSTKRKEFDKTDKNDQKTTKSDAEYRLERNQQAAYASIINNNIQGLSINYSNHIIPSLPNQVVIDMSKQLSNEAL